MRVIIGADLAPTSTNFQLFEEGNVSQLIDENIKSLLDNADWRIFNLELPLTDEKTPIKKNGVNLIAPTQTINGIKAIGADFLTLANNHINDQGEQGIISTMHTLSQNGIHFSGAGRNIDDCSKPFTFEKDGICVGVYCCAEHEFSVATSDRYGANPFDPLNSLDHISSLKDKVDYLIVLYHGGKEHYRYPLPNLQKRCRKMIEKGANLVVCQHSHCIGCKEEWSGGTIVYGQGNFIFDHSKSDFWKTGLLIELNLPEKNIRYIPICKENEKVRSANQIERQEILDGFEARSREIKNDGFIDAKFDELADEMLYSYLRWVSGKNTRGLFVRAIDYLSGHRLLKYYLSKKYQSKDLLMIKNGLTCETHNELFSRAIERKE